MRYSQVLRAGTVARKRLIEAHARRIAAKRRMQRRSACDYCEGNFAAGECHCGYHDGCEPEGGT